MKLQALTKFFLLSLAFSFAQKVYAEVYLYHPNSTLYLGGNFDPSKPTEVFPSCLESSYVRHESGLYLRDITDASPAALVHDLRMKLDKKGLTLEAQNNLIQKYKDLASAQDVWLLASLNVAALKRDASTAKEILDVAEKNLNNAKNALEKARDATDAMQTALEQTSEKIVPAETRFFMKSVANREELYKTLNVSLSLSGNLNFFGGGGNLSLEQKNTFNKNSLTWVIQGYSSFGKFMLEQPKLLEKYQDSTDLTLLRKSCGTSYVAQEVRGVQASAIFTVKNLTESDKSTLSGYLNSGYNSPQSRAQVTIQLSNLIEKISKSSQYEVSLHAIGGKGVSALAPIITHIADASAVLSILESYFKDLKFENAVPISYRTGSLRTLLENPQSDATEYGTEDYNKFIADSYLTYADLTAEEEQLAETLKNRMSDLGSQYRKAKQSFRGVKDLLEKIQDSTTDNIEKVKNLKKKVQENAKDINKRLDKVNKSLGSALSKSIVEELKNDLKVVNDLLLGLKDEASAFGQQDSFNVFLVGTNKKLGDVQNAIDTTEISAEKIFDSTDVRSLDSIRKDVQAAKVKLEGIMNSKPTQYYFIENILEADDALTAVLGDEPTKDTVKRAKEAIIKIPSDASLARLLGGRSLVAVLGDDFKDHNLEKKINEAQKMLKAFDNVVPDATDSAPREGLLVALLQRLLPNFQNSKASLEGKSTGFMDSKSDPITKDLWQYIDSLKEAKNIVVEQARNCKQVFDDYNNGVAERDNGAKTKQAKKEKTLGDCKTSQKSASTYFFAFNRAQYEEDLPQTKPYQLSYESIDEKENDNETVVFIVTGEDIESVQTGSSPSNEISFEKLNDEAFVRLNAYFVQGSKGNKGVSGSIYMPCAPQKQVGLRIEMADGRKYFEPIKVSTAEDSFKNKLKCNFSVFFQ